MSELNVLVWVAAVPVMLVLAPRLYRWLRFRRAASALASASVSASGASPAVQSSPAFAPITWTVPPAPQHPPGAPPTPFDALEIPYDPTPDADARLSRWTDPLYFGVDGDEFATFVRTRLLQVDDEIVARLLANPGWRERSAGAWLVALGARHDRTTQLGHLLLRSDVVHTGRAYCAALASLGSDAAIAWLERYLDYYLTRPDLEFDQDEAMAALAFLDRRDASTRLAPFLARWDRFANGRERWRLEPRIAEFARRMRRLEELRPTAQQ